MTAATNIDLSNPDNVASRWSVLQSFRFLKLVTFVFGAMFVSLGMMNAASAQAAAPQYTQDPLPDKYKDWGRAVIRGINGDEERENVVRMLHGADALQQAKLTDFFNNNVFSHFTQLNVVVLPYDQRKPDMPLSSQLSRYRTEFKKAFLAITDIADASVARSSREKLNSLIVERMYQIAINQDKNKAPQNYHPLARFNAAVMLAELNVNETVEGGAAGKQPFITASAPYGSLQSLVVLSIPTTQIPESARVAALRGLHRHVMSYGQGAPFDAKMISIINTRVIQPWLDAVKAPDAAIERDGHDWIRRRVVEIAVEMNNKQSNVIPNLISQLEKIVNEDGATIELRLAAIEGLAAQKQLPADFNLENLCVSMAKVAVSATRREIGLIESASVPPVSAKELKAELAQIEAAMKPHSEKSDKGRALATSLVALSKACDTKWWDPTGTTALGGIAAPTGGATQDPDALVKALRKAGGDLDKIITGKDSDLIANYIKIPKTKVTVTGGVTQGGVSGGFGGGRGRGRFEE